MRVALSGCIIARNDATRIKSCIESLTAVATEIVVVDTGSTDETANIARSAGARVESFPWCDDFAAARNYSLSLAREKWIVVIDTNEVLAPEQGALLGMLTESMQQLAYRCRIRNALPDGNEFVSYVSRLFRNDPRIRFTGRVHEQIEPSLAVFGAAPAPCELTILHTGYAVDPATNRAKAERNLRGLLRDLEDQPSDRFLALKVGQLYTTLGQHDRALDYLTRGASTTAPTLAAEAYNSIAGIRASRGEYELALRACAESITRIPQQRMGYVIISQILTALGRHADAAAQLQVARSIVGPTALATDLPEL